MKKHHPGPQLSLWSISRNWYDLLSGHAYPKVLSPFYTYNFSFHLLSHVSKDLYTWQHTSHAELCSLEHLISYFLLQLDLKIKD